MSNPSSTIKNFLTKRYEENQLASFYVLSAHPLEENKEAAIEDFLFSFFRQFSSLKNKSADALLSHPDLLWVGKFLYEEQNLLAELNEIYSFQDYSPSDLKHKFVILWGAHKFSITHYNKLLKLLEEPNKKTTFILTNPENSLLLPTIQSRAQNLKLNLLKETKELDENLLKEVLEQNIGQLLEKTKNKEQLNDTQLALSVIKEKLRSHQSTYGELLELQTQLKILEEQKVFRHAISTRLFSWLSLAKKAKSLT